jgi:hypothetical protein
MEFVIRGEGGESKSSVPGRLEQFVKCMSVLEAVKVFKVLVHLRRKQVGYASYKQLRWDFVQIEQLIDRELDN